LLPRHARPPGQQYAEWNLAVREMHEERNPMTTITIDRAVVKEALDFIVATNKSFQFWLVPESNLNKKTVTALRAALAQQDESETCTWHQDGDSDSGVYATSCRRYFNLEDGTPEDNKMQWCCYCGKRLVQELITEDGDE
jgi:hypothetical protein